MFATHLLNNGLVCRRPFFEVQEEGYSVPRKLVETIIVCLSIFVFNSNFSGFLVDIHNLAAIIFAVCVPIDSRDLRDPCWIKL